MEEAFKRIQQFCSMTIGLDSHEISTKAWQRILQQRKVQTGTDDDASYLRLLQSSAGEQEKLFELLIVSESWFFRDKGAFDYMAHYCLSRSRELLHLLSVPCATGEEPYSMAMALIDAGLAAKQFHIDAVDINKAALLRAEKGLYTKNAFRGKSLTHCAHHVTRQDHSYLVEENIRRQVHFHIGNVCTYSKGMPYQVAFCRNLLIYMNADARKKALDNLRRLLDPEGLLFVGPAEIEIVRRHGFVSVGPARAYALQSQKKNVAVKAKAPKKEILQHKKEERYLEEARRCADAGSYADATRLCLKHIELYGADPEAYFLLGLVQHANKEEGRAKEYFLKAVYLQPDHYEALICLALLAEQQGDAEQAELYRRRAMRFNDV